MIHSVDAVLVVDDHPFQRRTLTRMLKELGVTHILEAGNGREALDLLAESEVCPQVAVCDLNMPEMDGLELIRHLGNTRQGMAVIVASAQDRSLLDSVDKMSLAYGVRLLGSFEKPITLSKLRAMFKRYPATERIRPQPASTVREYTLERILLGIQAQEFEPFYQPKVDMTSGQVVGAEALARWRHPDDGLVSPYAFIQTLEAHCRIDDLTFVMLDRAARDCFGWQKAGNNASVSVNLSLVSLEDTSLAERIWRTVQCAGLDAGAMILEVTETAAMTDLAPALENLVRLRMKGFRLAIDDYGTGFSTMQQLTRVPFTELKIDQTFVTGCSADSPSRVLLKSAIDVAHGLSMSAVAEGVEFQEDWTTVQELGCDLAQGFLLAKPMALDGFEDFCQKNTHLPS